MIRFKDVTKVVLVLALCFGFAGVGNAGDDLESSESDFLRFAENYRTSMVLHGEAYADYNYKCPTDEMKRTDKCKSLKRKLESEEWSFMYDKQKYEDSKSKYGDEYAKSKLGKQI
jgi:hypothetical protein